MKSKKKNKDLGDKIHKALTRASNKLIAETKALNSYLVIADKDGKVKRVYAKDL